MQKWLLKKKRNRSTSTTPHGDPRRTISLGRGPKGGRVKGGRGWLRANTGSLYGGGLIFEQYVMKNNYN